MPDRLIKLIPNALTFANLLMGFHVILLQVIYPDGRFRLAACFMLIAAVLLDALDGKLARFLDAESDFGKQMDSFADFTSFGIAPMVLFLSSEAIREIGMLIYICILIYVVCGAFRLARFNVGDYKDHFIGLPITAAGLVFAITNLILHATQLTAHPLTIYILAALILVTSVLMVGNFEVRRIGAQKEPATSDDAGLR